MPPLLFRRQRRRISILLQTVTPVLVLLILQTCAFAFDTHGWGRWQIWRWIIAATGLLVGYSLLHLR